jgi:hypothetical protein
MDQVALLTAMLLLSILGQGKPDPPNGRLVTEIPFDTGETQIQRPEQTMRLYDARNAVIDAQQKNPVRVIIEGHFDGQADSDNTRRAVARAAATKKWLQNIGGLYGIPMDDRVGAYGENKRVAKIWIEQRAENDPGRTVEGPRIVEPARLVTDIVFPPNISELRDFNHLWETREGIRSDVLQKGPARLVIEGHAARNETNAATRAGERAATVKRWFEAWPIDNLQLSEKAIGTQENKSMVRLIIEREQRQTTR